MATKIIIPHLGQQRRFSSIFLHIGAKKTGKTQGTLNMAVDMFKQQKKPVLVLDKGSQEEYEDFHVIDIDDLPGFNKVAQKATYKLFRCRVSSEEDILKFFTYVNQHIKNSFVIFEDATSYAVGNIPRVMKDLILNSRNACNDYLFNLHSLSEPAPFLFRHAEFLILRRTSDVKVPTKIPVQNKIERAMREIAQENAELYKRPEQPKLAFRLIDITSAD
jgi:hypothetical protein